MIIKCILIVFFHFRRNDAKLVINETTVHLLLLVSHSDIFV